MLSYIDFFENISGNVEKFLIFLLILIFVANIIDTTFGWVNAKFNKNIVFQSSIALYGIIKKMMYFIALVFFSVVTLAIIPHDIAIGGVIAFYIGYLLSEVNSIASHLGLTEDGKKGEIFIDFIKRILNSYGGSKK